jgi:hypothetical protein
MRKNPLSDLQGMLSLIKASKNPFSPIVEAFNNSLESIFKLDDSLDRNITIELFFNDQDENSKQLEFIKITDSGVGFNEEAFERFERLLDRTKGFNNRGSGRLQYLHRFAELSVKSVYSQGGTFYLRQFCSSKDSFIYDDPAPKIVESGKFETTLTLKHLRTNKKDNAAYSKLKFNGFVSWIKSQFALRAYLERTKGKVFPTINLKFSYQLAETEDLTIEPFDFPEPTGKGNFSVPYQEPFDDNGKVGWRKAEGLEAEKFSWCVFSFPANEVDIHGAFLCSKDIPVEEVKNPILKKSNGHLGTKMVTAFYGDFLDKPDNVSHSVDSFVIPNKADVKELSNSLFGVEAEIYLDDIKELANKQLKSIYKEIEIAQESVERKVMLLARELGFSNHIAINVKKAVKLNDDEELITKNLHIEEAKYVANKSNQARKVIDQLEKMDPTSPNYQEELEEKSGELSSLIDSQNKEELSKYVVRRELVANLLDKILNKGLAVQTEELPKRKNRSKEGIIHDLIFKRKSESKLNDLWILEEDFVHFDSCSDLPLDKIKSESGDLLLKDIPPEEVKRLQLKITKQPDVFLFASEGKCILIEFKATDVDLTDYLQQTEKYCALIANYSIQKIEKFYCYLIGETINTIDVPADYERTVNDTWLREKIRIVDQTEKRNVIAYSQQEILKLSDIAARAHRRNRSFAEKLGLDFFKIKDES